MIGQIRHSTIFRHIRLFIVGGIILITRITVAAVDPASLPQIGWHLGGVAYWDTPYFANALANGGQWIEFEDFQWGAGIAHFGNPQFNENGFPKYLNTGKKLRAVSFALHVENENRPAVWPSRRALAQGRVALAWKGDADVRLNAGGTFLAADSSGAATGRLVDGKRVYRFEGGAYVQFLEVHDIGTSPITDLKIWLANPADPQNASLEGQAIHPTLLQRLADAPWGFIRFMNWQETNANPQQDWNDRRRPAHIFQTGALNPRAPATGSPGNRGSGSAHEFMPLLCNAAQKDLWLCVPHMATDDYVRKLARLIRFGSDGVEPYAAPQASPKFPPLDPARRVFIEYSNEIWASGSSFPQGDWAQEQATGLGITKAQFNARRFVQIWRIFEEEFGAEASRLVRVGAVFTAGDFYTQPFLAEMATYGATFTPTIAPDVIAVTTYFGNGIQDWAFERAQAMAGTADQWFLTDETWDLGGGVTRPVSVPAGDPYWTGADFQRHMGEAFTEWKYRLLSGDAREGAGPDAVGIGGGFGLNVRQYAQTMFPAPVPVIAYEGGPSLYTDNRDGGDPRDDGLTTFMEAMNSRPEFADVYRLHLNMAKSKGLWSHVMFTDVSRWGKYGQWGHLEFLDQAPTSSPKYQFLLDWISEQAAIRHIDAPLNAVPQFDTPHNLPVAIWGQPYTADITVSGGDGARTVALIGAHLVEGLNYDALPADANRVRIAGTPAASGLSFVYLRVTDADGDPDWRTFTIRTVGGPGTLLEPNLEGANPAQSAPWMPTYVLAPGVAYSGFTRGAGAIAQPGDNALVWSVNAPADEAAATLANAIADNEYWAITLTPPDGATISLRGEECRFTIRRRSWHAPRRYAMFTSVGGFATAAEVFASERSQEEADLEFAFTFPDTTAYAALAAPTELRLYGFQAQYGGHATSLMAFKLNGKVNSNSQVSDVMWKVR